MILPTARQQHRIDKLVEAHPGAYVDFEFTKDLRATVKGADRFIAVVANLPDAEVRMWTIDVEGDIIAESGAGPKE